MEYTEGQEVKYKGKKTHIEEIYEDGTCKISNPEWYWDSEGQCTELGIDYDLPYWITVKLEELKPN